MAYGHRMAALLAALLLCAAAIAGTLAARPAAAWADEGAQAGTIAFAVVNKDGSGYLVEPVLVPYTSGQTLEQALTASDYQVTFSGGFLSSIMGEEAGQSSVWYTGGWRDGIGYSVPCDQVSSCFISLYAAQEGSGVTLSEDHATLLSGMGAFLGRNDGVRNYPAAITAYDNARTALRTASGTAGELAACANDLESALSAYDEMMGGAVYATNFDIARTGTSASDLTVTVTDAYGNVTNTTAQGTVSLVAGTYNYEAFTLDGRFGVRGTFQSGADLDNQTVSAQLPSADWVSALELLDNGNGKRAVPSTGTFAGNDLVFEVPDYCRELNSVFLHVLGTSSAPAANGSSQAGSGVRVTAYYNHARTGAATQMPSPVAFGSTTYSMDYLVAPGLRGTEATVEAYSAMDSSALAGTGNTSLTQVERAHAVIHRAPTLASLSVTADGAESIAGFAPATTAYAFNAATDAVVVTPSAAYSGAAITVNGQAVSSGSSATVSLHDGENVITVTLTSEEGATTTYTVTATKKAASQMTFTHSDGVQVAVVNSSGGTCPAASSTAAQDVYNLVEGDSYTVVGTKDAYYHASLAFTASAGASIAVPDPIASDWLSRVVLGSSGSVENGLYEKDASSSEHNMTFTCYDVDTTMWLGFFGAEGAPEASFSASWNSQRDGKLQVKDAFTTMSGASGAQPTPTRALHGTLTGFHRQGGWGNSAALTVTRMAAGSSGETYYQDYNLRYRVRPTLRSLAVYANGNRLTATQTATLAEERPSTVYNGKVTDYTVKVPSSLSMLTLTCRFPEPAASINADAGYQAVVGGEGIDSQTFVYGNGQPFSAEVPLTGEDGQDITITVTHADPDAQATVYHVRVQQLPEVKVRFTVDPSDAVVNLVSNATGQRVMPDEEGVYLLTQTYTYDWTVGKVGYVGQSGTISADEDQSVAVTLSQATVNPTIDAGVTGEWPNFRLGDDNVSAVDAPTPQTDDDALLYWAQKLGSGFGASATGCPILVDGYLYTYGTAPTGDDVDPDLAGRPVIYKLDASTGKTVAAKTMAYASSFSINPPCYAEGMIFVGESGGRVEAFDAKTLDSLWLYEDPKGGQPNCPITYYNGCIYTGFWNGYDDTTSANFVCLTITDEDPSQPGHVDTHTSSGVNAVDVKDRKRALWTHLQPAGYYWAGAIAKNGVVYMGCDDAVNEESGSAAGGPGHLLAFDAATGAVLDDFTGFTGDVRTQITWDEQTGYFYFMTKNGYLCRFKAAADGTVDAGSFSRLNFDQGGGSGAFQCTTTPAIANGRAYVGVRSGEGHFGAYGGHALAVVDLSTFQVIYTVATQGYVQATPAISTAYQDRDGYNYVYFIENITPGKLRVIRDKAGMTQADDWSLTAETYTDSSGVTRTATVARALFTPKGDQAQYAICSPIVDSSGTLYFKNDSAYMMAVGAKIVSLDVVTPPSRTIYLPGETFDPTGIKVVATLSNGLTRDVTKYVSYSMGADDAFSTTGTQTIRVTYPYTRYQTSSDVAGTIPFICPSASVDVTVAAEAAPSVHAENLGPAYVPYLTHTGAYQHQFQASSSSAITSWTLDGQLPQGLSFDSATGLLSGTPAAGSGGTYAFQVAATNATGTSNPVGFTLDVYEYPQIDPLTVPQTMSAALGSMYRHVFKATGYPNPTWTVASGTLPDGLSLSSDGVLSGQPAKAGTYVFAIQADNAYGFFQRSYQITFTVLEPVSITTTALSDATAGVAYSAQLTAAGNPAPTWTWRAAAGSTLPPGIELDAGSGSLAGVPAAGGSYAFTVTADNGTTSDSKDLILTVNQAPAITTSSLAGALVGENYSAELAATGYPERFAWALAAGSSLPAGLSLDPATGTVSGTPLKAGAFAFTVTAANSAGEAAADLSLIVSKAPEVTTASLPDATIGEAYRGQLAASAYPADVRWTVSAGALPAGIALDAASGALIGTPTEAGTFTFTVTAANAAGTGSREYTIISSAAPAITTSELPLCLVGEDCSVTLAATGSPAPTWRVTEGALPEGMTLDASTGVLSGTPAATGTYAFTVEAANEHGTAAKSLSVTVAQRPSVVTTSLTDALAGREYAATLEATGFPAVTWSLAEGTTLPAGLSLDAHTGALTGTPTQAGTYNFGVVALNGVGQAQRELSLTVNQAPSITTGSLATATKGEPYGAGLDASGYPAPSWSVVAGELPAGLSISGNTLVGTPETVGDYAFTLQADNGVAPAATREYSLSVYGTPAIVTNDLAGATVGEDYSATLASDVHGACTWALATGNRLPAGLSLDPATGTISGTPTQSGTVRFQVTVTYRPSQTQVFSATKAFTLQVRSTPVITTDSLPDATAGEPYTGVTLSADAYPAATWSVVGGALPEGLALDPDTGALSGTPAEGGLYQVTFQAENSQGAAAKELALAVKQAPSIVTAALPAATARHAYSARLEASGYPGEFTWVRDSGDLPAGLTLDPGTGVISGIPARAGSFTFSVSVDNGAGRSASRSYTITVAASPSRVERLAGQTADGTAAAIASAAWGDEKSEYVVIARDDTYYDALSGAGLAGALKAPILLTGGSALSDDCRAAVESLGATKAVVLGGENAVSSRVAASLGDMGLSVERVAGADVYGTSMACTRYLLAHGGSAEYAIACSPTSFYDAVSVSGWAYANKVPVMLQTWGGSAAERGFDAEAASVIAGRDLIVCGGTGAVTDESVSGLGAASITRLGGATIYDTSLAIAKWELEHGMSAADVSVASAIQQYNGVDALAASALAGKRGGVVLLAQSNPSYYPPQSMDMALGFISDHAGEVEKVHVLGGAVANTPELYSAIGTALGE
ncbi:MAG: putative Ig domain-containing protein [Coriobacteriales bacterium]|nr:putative Ig domain-containing protein [Coriobacteriales bacterium]